MTDLGPALESEGGRVDLAPGARERFEHRLVSRRRIRKVSTFATALAIGVLGVAIAVSALSERSAGGPAGSASPKPVASREVLPTGVYWTGWLTHGEILAALQANGFGEPRQAHHFFTDLGSFSHVVRFGIQVRANGIWEQVERRDHGPAEGGWTGAYRATGPGEITAYGYGCTISYSVVRSLDSVRIGVLNEQGPTYKGICGPRDLAAQTAIYETATFKRQH